MTTAAAKVTTEQKMENIKQDIEDALIGILRTGKPGEYIVTARVFCGDGGGISGARVGLSSESAVNWSNGNG